MTRSSNGSSSYGLRPTSTRIPTWYARSTTRNATWIPRFPTPRNAPRVRHLYANRANGQSTPTWIPPTPWIPRSYALPSWSDAPWVRTPPCSGFQLMIDSPLVRLSDCVVVWKVGVDGVDPVECTCSIRPRLTFGITLYSTQLMPRSLPLA
jgi:hypothetical protein